MRSTREVFIGETDADPLYAWMSKSNVKSNGIVTNKHPFLITTLDAYYSASREVTRYILRYVTS